jgi:hypothetical protein
MSELKTASPRITDEVTSWPGVEAGPGKRGEFAFTVRGREIGHLHGDRAAHFSFPKPVWRELSEQGRIVDHPVFPGRQGPAARAIRSEADIADVIELLRLNYDPRRPPRASARGHARLSGRLQETELEGLYASAPEPLPFAPSLHIRAQAARVEGRRVSSADPLTVG